MANWIATNVLSGAVETPKYVEIGIITEIYTVALTTALANGDTIFGPTMPAGCYLMDVKVDVDQLDTNGTPLIAFEAGYTGALAAFIASGNATARTGGIQPANVHGTVGFTAATNTQVLVTVTAAAATAAAGTMRIALSYTASP